MERIKTLIQNKFHRTPDIHVKEINNDHNCTCGYGTTYKGIAIFSSEEEEIIDFEYWDGCLSYSDELITE